MAQEETVGLARKLGGVVVFVAMAAITVDVHAQNVERGRQLYENHCQVCHTSQVHGRKNRSALSVDDLRDIVRRWQESQGLRWSREEIDDVTQYLATTKYHFSASLGARSLVKDAVRRSD